MEVLVGRMVAKRTGAPRPDTLRLCLAAEGEAMRGVVSYGMLLALRDLDMLDLFDFYIGVSAGGFNLAYILAGQDRQGLGFYLEDMPSNEFSNLLRFQFEDRPFVDMRRLQEHLQRKKPLAIDALRRQYAHSLTLGVTNVSQNRGELVSLDKNSLDFETLLFAGSVLPFIDGEPWVVGDKKYYDGSLYYIDPILAAIDQQATHVFVLYGQPQDKPVQSYSEAIERRVNRLNKQHPEAGNHYLAALQAYASIYSSLPFGETKVQDMHTYRHALPQLPDVDRETVDQAKLTAAMKQGYQSILDLFYHNGQVSLMPRLSKAPERPH